MYKLKKIDGSHNCRDFDTVVRFNKRAEIEAVEVLTQLCVSTKEQNSLETNCAVYSG